MKVTTHNIAKQGRTMAMVVLMLVSALGAGIAVDAARALPPTTEPGHDDLPALVSCIEDLTRWCRTGALPHGTHAMAADGDHIALLHGGQVHVYARELTIDAAPDTVTVSGWKHVTTMTPSGGPHTGQSFGTLHAIAIDGNTVVVGAYQEESVDFWAGAAYVFTWAEDGTWAQQARLLASDAARGRLFGASVDIDDDTIVVGSYRNNEHHRRGGAAYVFERDSGDVWTETQVLFPSDGGAYKSFGRSVAVAGDQLVVGAGAGTVYVFDRTEGSWAETARWGAGFGAHRLQFDGKHLVVGGLSGARESRADIYAADADGKWVKSWPGFTGPGNVHILVDLSLHGNRLAIGDVPGGLPIVTHDPATGTWEQTANLAHSHAVALAGDTLFVGNGTIYECGLPLVDDPFAACDLRLP